MSKKECIDKLSEYFMIARNHYKYIPILVQQQNLETLGLDAFKANRIRPTLAGLADSKNPGKDCTLMIGITNPFAFELPEYLKYDITQLRSYARFFEIVLNREGSANNVLALYFDGATNYFVPLPAYTETQKLQRVYNLIRQNESSSV